MITTNVADTIAYIQLQAGVAVDAADDILYGAAWDVADLAKAYVPIDEYNLQDAITVEPTSDGYKVFIDMTHEGTRADTVERYALAMENGIGWSGIARAGPPRGAHFMARAAAEIEEQLEYRTQQATKKTTMSDRVSGSAFVGAIGNFAKRAKSSVGSFIKRLFR